MRQPRSGDIAIAWGVSPKDANPTVQSSRGAATLRKRTMPSTYANLTYHVVFGTKYRKPTLTDAIRSDIYSYIAGIIANKHGRAIEIGGIADHIHVVTSCPATIAVADFVRDLKANSSKWLREDKAQRDFQWQTGYGAFTVSRSQIDVSFVNMFATRRNTIGRYRSRRVLLS